MSDLLKKLNVLIRAGVRGEGKQQPHDAPRPGKTFGKDMEREVEALRGRITAAQTHEGRIQAQLRELEDEITRWDQAADEALRANAQEDARAALLKLRAARRRYARLEDDLRQHERLTQELIQSVNLLAGVVNEAQSEQANQPQQTADHERAMTEVLRQAREKIATLGELVSPTRAESREAAEPAPAPQEINDDLEQRRQRLSRR
jgi:phage shock protein A